ncbi:hypothetical protein GCM10007320_63360 [Pseudorhodoferax aquiterrae]|uniref:Uncharacterized protein n=1 Tax=Pseudorhodoferax aquiterrae TaxID=747304 RepID=A0ABQ3GED1_9BURK|nr:hypothetical protein GCM10007320_63360 [Pseudorhodoferax aquiterrae]
MVLPYVLAPNSSHPLVVEKTTRRQLHDSVDPMPGRTGQIDVRPGADQQGMARRY